MKKCWLWTLSSFDIALWSKPWLGLANYCTCRSYSVKWNFSVMFFNRATFLFSRRTRGHYRAGGQLGGGQGRGENRGWRDQGSRGEGCSWGCRRTRRVCTLLPLRPGGCRQYNHLSLRFTTVLTPWGCRRY